MRSVALGGVILALVLAGCGSSGDSGTGGGSGGRVVDKDVSGDSEEMDAFIEDSLEVEQGEIDKYREQESSGVVDDGGSVECEIGYRSCCDEGEIFLKNEMFDEPMCFIVS